MKQLNALGPDFYFFSAINPIVCKQQTSFVHSLTI